MSAAIHTYDNAFGVHRIHDAGALAYYYRARIASGDVLHAGSHVGSFGAQQRNRLALHVRSHQRAVRVVILYIWYRTGGHRYQLLRTDVHVFDFVAMLQDEVAGLASI